MSGSRRSFRVQTLGRREWLCLCSRKLVSIIIAHEAAPPLPGAHSRSNVPERNVIHGHVCSHADLWYE